MEEKESKERMKLSGRTKLYGLFGSPVEHSKSPAMYNYCFEKWGLDQVYLAFDVSAEDAGKAIEAFRTMGMKGANVTMPCKQAVVPYLDEISDAVRLSGACNTIVEKDGKLTGHNTDGQGYVINLKAHGVDIRGKKLVLLGAGGASTAIQVQSLLDGAEKVSVFNQKDAFWDKAEAKIQELQKEFPDRVIELLDLADEALLAEKIREADILTNATRVGMKPMDDMSLIQDLSLLRPDLVVADTVYEPEETKLLRDAKVKGCKTVGGLGMLLYQGAVAVELYTGQEMPIEEIKKELYTK